MEAFQLLSKGGAKFDKRRFESDVKLFSPSLKGLDTGKKPATAKNELPPELDFFRYAKGGPSAKRKAPHGKEVDVGEQSEEEDEARSSREKRRKVETNAAATPKTAAQRVRSKGTNVPEPITSFQSLKERYNLPSLILNNLEKNGWQEPTGIQAHGIPMLMESRDIAAISPTGTGKTLSYLLPIFALLRSPVSASQSGLSSSTDQGSGVRAVVLAPTRELAHQIHNECLKLAQGRKWRIVLFSKASATTLADKAVRDKIDIIISTPMRIVSCLQENKLELNNVRHLVLDEADRMLDTEFLPQVQEVIEACTYPSLQKAIFSATLPAGAEQIAMDMLKNPIRVVVGLKDTPLPLIRQSLVYVADESSKLPSLVTYLSSTTPAQPNTEQSTAPPPWAPPILIFTSTQPRATSLCAQLILHGIQNVDVLHASLTNKQRDDVVHRMLAGQCWVLVCTEVVARGMDFRGIRGVINYDWPQSVQSYVHRIGRTGRAGREGIAVTYWTDEDAPFLKSIANVLLQSGSPVPDWMLKLPKPSKLKKRQMGKVKRGDEVDDSGRIGRADAIKKRDMILGSKRRKEKAKGHNRGESEGDPVWTGLGNVEM